jgi:hypothetical protein
MLVADILGGDQLRGWLAPPSAPTDGLEREAHEAAVEREAILLAGLRSPSGRVRSAAAMTVAMVPALKGLVPALVDLAVGDADAVARAGALLALARLGGDDAAATAAIADARAAGASPLVRGAAAMAWLRQDATRSFDEVGEELSLWLGYGPSDGTDSPHDPAVPWFKLLQWYPGLFFPDALARALVGLGRSRGATGIEALAKIARAMAVEARGAAEAQLAKVMLDLGGFSPHASSDVVLVEELTAEQRSVATQFASTHLLPGGGFGLPASGAVRRRWLGLEPAGPLDRLVATPAAASAPLWRAWRGRLPEAEDFASPVDRWQAVLEYMSGSYPPAFRGPRIEELDAELARLTASDELWTRVERVGEDLAQRFGAIFRTRTIAPFADIRVSVLFFGALLRGGRPLLEVWDDLIHVGMEPRSRELLEKLPLERRERALLRAIRSANPATLAGAGVLVLTLIDLAPTPIVARALSEAIETLASKPFGEKSAEQLRAGLADATTRFPALAG